MVTVAVSSEILANAPRLALDTAPHIYKIDATTVVKKGGATQLAEAAAMKLVRSPTSIPVPEVYNAYMDENSNNGYIIMEFIEGVVLRDVWDGMDSIQKGKIISQLRTFMTELRTIKGKFIGSVDGSYCSDQFLLTTLEAMGLTKPSRHLMRTR